MSKKMMIMISVLLHY